MLCGIAPDRRFVFAGVIKCFFNNGVVCACEYAVAQVLQGRVCVCRESWSVPALWLVVKYNFCEKLKTDSKQTINIFNTFAVKLLT